MPSRRRFFFRKKKQLSIWLNIAIIWLAVRERTKRQFFTLCKRLKEHDKLRDRTDIKLVEAVGCEESRV